MNLKPFHVKQILKPACKFVQVEQWLLFTLCWFYGFIGFICGKKISFSFLFANAVRYRFTLCQLFQNKLLFTVFAVLVIAKLPPIMTTVNDQVAKKQFEFDIFFYQFTATTPVIRRHITRQRQTGQNLSCHFYIRKGAIFWICEKEGLWSDSANESEAYLFPYTLRYRFMRRQPY